MRVAGRERRAAAVLTLFVVVLRIWFARKVTFCGTPDSCYALGLAQNLAQYHAFRAPFLFDLQLNHLHVPNTGIEYWRPGVSLLFLLLKPVGGVTLHSALILAALAGVLWAAAAWFIAERATGSRKIALASYGLCLLLSPGWGGSLTPDPTLFYAAAIAWFLALFTVERQGFVQDVLALVCVGAAYMIRNDAGLLLIPLVVVLWLRLRAAKERQDLDKRAPLSSSVGYAIGILVGFGLALVPMHLLYRHILGTAFPAGAGQALYLNDLSEFSMYGVPVSLHTMLSHGVKHLVLMRVGTTALIVYRVLALVLGYPALVFLPTLFLRSDEKRVEPLRLPELAGPVAFGATMLVVYSLVLPAVGVFSALRSSTAVLPVASVIVVLAILRTAKTLRLAQVLTATVIAIYLVSGLMDDRRSIDPMNQIGDADLAQARLLKEMGATPDGSTVVMTPDPVQFSVTTGLPAIPMPGNGLDAITNEALDLHASHAILDGEHLPGSLAEVTERLRPVQTRTVSGQTVILFELPRELKQQ
jgi:Dolichyl-phosphate-mannose-protein mannosyltransferase